MLRYREKHKPPNIDADLFKQCVQENIKRYKENKKEFNGKSYLHSIELKGAWFGFLSQSDWKTYNSGQNATVSAQTMKSNFIKFI